MKKGILLAIICLLSIQLFAQTDGISYQAVIIGPDNQELPGVDAEGNILPNATIAIRFSILDETNTMVYQEVQTTNTDEYGRINLLIGKADLEAFTQIKWDGTPKDLKVEIDFSGVGGDFVDMSREELTFVPYSYHRNIIARGTLIVDDTTDLNGELKVQGPANLNSTLNVNNNNATNLSGQLNVEGETNLKSTFIVDGLTTLNDSLNVAGNSNFTGKMKVIDDALFEGKVEFDSEEPAEFRSMIVEDTMRVDGLSNLNGQVTITATSSSTKSNEVAKQDNFNDYALKVQGRAQGIAVEVNLLRSIDNNFISFWDQKQADGSVSSVKEGTMWGRIEGLSESNLENSEEYKNDLKSKTWDGYLAGYSAGKSINTVIMETVGVGTDIADVRVCAGLGACATLPSAVKIAFGLYKVIVAVVDAALSLYNYDLSLDELINFEDYRKENIGVTYASGAGDYAEWLPKDKNSDIFESGELVGIKNGRVTKNTWGVEKIMIVSTRPIVLGNMPQPNQEKNSVKIAFMGQVPVKVLGKVSPGDYILPNEFGIGLAKAVAPVDMKTRDYKKIAGVAWNVIEEFAENLRIVNVAVGINTNDLSGLVSEQEQELKTLKSVFNELKGQIEKSNSILADLVPGYTEAIAKTEGNVIQQDVINKENKEHKSIEDTILYTDEDEIIYLEISREQIESAFDMVRENYIKTYDDSKITKRLILGDNDKLKKVTNKSILMPIEEHPIWKKIDTDSAYKEGLIALIKEEFDKAFHIHKKYAPNFTDLKVRK